MGPAPATTGRGLRPQSAAPVRCARITRRRRRRRPRGTGPHRLTDRRHWTGPRPGRRSTGHHHSLHRPSEMGWGGVGHLVVPCAEPTRSPPHHFPAPTAGGLAARACSRAVLRGGLSGPSHRLPVSTVSPAGLGAHMLTHTRARTRTHSHARTLSSPLSSLALSLRDPSRRYRGGPTRPCTAHFPRSIAIYSTRDLLAIRCPPLPVQRLATAASEGGGGKGGWLWPPVP